MIEKKLPIGVRAKRELRKQMGRPSQGRSVRLQINVTPEVTSWLESMRGPDQSISDVVFHLLEGIWQSK